MSTRALVTSANFGRISDEPLRRLEEAGFRVERNTLGRRWTPDELAEMIDGFDVVIAGLDRFDRDLLDATSQLQMISRIGIGLDNVDLEACRDLGIRVSYTPDAPTVAVAELNVALIIDCLRQITHVNRLMDRGGWERRIGRQLRGSTVGILGFGRIGKTTARLLSGFGVSLIASDPVWDVATARALDTERRDFDALLRESDVVLLCVPLDESTRRFIGWSELECMKPSAILVNAARGGLVDEAILIEALEGGAIAGAALDVFETEPYRGKLAGMERVVTTCHMGGSTDVSRQAMELGAVDEAIRFVRGETLLNPVV